MSIHRTHNMRDLKGVLKDQQECQYCVVCTCCDRQTRLEKVCVSNPEIRAKRTRAQIGKLSKLNERIGDSYDATRPL